MAANEKPGLAAAYYNIGAMHQNSDQLQLAMENYEKALKIDSNIEMASTNLDYVKGYLERQKKQQEAAGAMTLEKTSPAETPENLFEPDPAVEEAPAIEKAPVESFDAVQEESPVEEPAMETAEESPAVEESFDTADEASDEEIATESFETFQEETPAVESFDTAEESPVVEESFDTADEALDEEIATESFDATVESGVESSPDGLESPEVTPVGTTDENPEVTPIGTSADSFETTTGIDSGNESPEATVEEPAAEESSDNGAVDSNDYSFRNF